MQRMADGSDTDVVVTVADAQDFETIAGSEVKLVITLRAADDPEGSEFGAKVMI